VCASRCGPPSVSSAAPNDDAPWSNGAVADSLVRLKVEPGELISDQVVRDFAMVVRVKEA
jgi:hypothetical protein